MHWRSTLCLTVLTASVLATDAEAQRARGPRKKPFEALSQSAQRLKQSAADRLGFREAPRDSVIAVDLPEYILGAERPGVAFDCSGLVRFVMSALRIDLPRTANEQAQRGRQVEREVGALRPGDLLTFGRGSRVTHIGVYIGEGRFVHASTSKRRVIEASIDQPGTWFRRNWMGVRRLLATAEVADTTG
jgi:NlpC/P60 family